MICSKCGKETPESSIYGLDEDTCKTCYYTAANPSFDEKVADW